MKRNKWSAKYDLSCCSNCGANDKIHIAFGLCFVCYGKYKKQKEQIEKYGKILSKKEWTNKKKLISYNSRKKQWDHPEFRNMMKKRLSESAIERFEDPIYRKKYSDLMKNRWTDSGFRKKMIKLRNGRAFRKNQSAAVRKSSKKNWKNPIYRKKMRDCNKKLWKNPEFREKIKRAREEYAAEGKSFNKQGKRGCYLSKKIGKIYFQSSYELKAYKKLDKIKKVVSYKRGPRIIYKDNENKEHYYFSDILVMCEDGRKYLIEIKSRYTLNSYEYRDLNSLKFSAARKYCRKRNMRFIIWTEKTLYKKNMK